MVVKHTLEPRDEDFIYCRMLNGMIDISEDNKLCRNCKYFCWYNKEGNIVCEYDDPIYKHDVVITDHDAQYELLNIWNKHYNTSEGLYINNVRKAPSYEVWKMLRSFADLFCQDQDNIIDCMGMDFDIIVYKGDTVIRDYMDAYNRWLSEFLQLIKAYENTDMLIKSKVAFDEMSLYDCRKAFGLPVYDIEVVMQDIRDIDCECIVEISKYDEQDFRFLKNDFGKAEYSIFIPDIKKTLDHCEAYNKISRIYRTIFDMVYTNDIHSIAIPVIDFTEDKYPDEYGLRIAVEKVIYWFGENPDYKLKVYLCCDEAAIANMYDRFIYESYCDEMEDYFG